MKILVLLLASASALAQTISLEDRVKDVYHECLPANRWSAPPAIQRRPQNYRQFYQPFSKLSWLENNFITFAYPDLLWEGWKGTEALQLFNSVIEKAKEISNNEQLSDLQKVCLSQCISSRIINVDPNAKVSFKNLAQLFESVPSTIQKGEATCRGFARVYYKIASELNLKSELVASTRHIFSEVNTSAGKVHLDPRDQTCYLWR